MTEDDTRTMQEHGITCEIRETFHFQGHRYERLSDAINYAQLQLASINATPAQAAPESAGPSGENH